MPRARNPPHVHVRDRGGIDSALSQRLVQLPHHGFGIPEQHHGLVHIRLVVVDPGVALERSFDHHHVADRR